MEYIHRKKDKLYGVWRAMRDRCYNVKQISYKNYGKKGITVCDEWRFSYDRFKKFAFENGYKSDLQIDRIDSNGNYEPSNCRFVTRKEQARNKSNNTLITVFGETKNLSSWAEDPRCKTTYNNLILRISTCKWSVERAITEPDNRPNQYKAFGEYKALREWSNDPRCVVSYDTLCQRIKTIKTKLSMEEAITTPLAIGGILCP